MTVVQMQDNNYMGLDSDTKPTDNVPPGVTFWEYDTDFLFVWDNTAWRHVSRALNAEHHLYEFLKNAGSRDMVVNGSSTPVKFKYTVPVGKYVEVERINIVIEDGSIDPVDFGGLGALGNGLEIEAYTAADALAKDFCAGFPIQSNADWGGLSGVDNQPYYGTGAALDSLNIRFSLYKGNEALRLDAGEYLQFTINDNMAGIDKFDAMIQGKIFDAD